VSSEKERIETDALRIELQELGATMLQSQLLQTNVERARAAIAQAYDRGAGNPLSYAISLFRSEGFEPEKPAKPKPTNAHGKVDPTRTDDGERIWQWHEVDEKWRHEYLADCIAATQEGRDPKMRYQPSDEEFDRVSEIARAAENAVSALDAWATLWGFDDLRQQLEYEEVPF
jgi:hypothetical protein